MSLNLQNKTIENINKNTVETNGIMFDIRSNEETNFKRDTLFKFLHDHPKETTIPDSYMNDYMTELNHSTLSADSQRRCPNRNG